MKVRIPAISLEQTVISAESTRKVALGLSSLMTPAAVAAYALGCWRIASDLDFAARFVISRGLFSHWQVWLAVGAGIHAGALTLARLGRGNVGSAKPEAPRRHAA